MENILITHEKLTEVKETINTLLYSFVRQEEFISLSDKDRNKIVDHCISINGLIDREIQNREDKTDKIPAEVAESER